MELGEQATPFEHRSFADDYAACQRYYQFADNRIWTGDITSGQDYYMSFARPVTMRATPTQTYTSISESGFNSSTIATPSSDLANNETVGVLGTADTTMARGYYYLHITSDAEL